MDNKFSDKYRKTNKPSVTNNKKTSSSSQQDLLKLKKELEEKKRILEQKLLEVEKGKKRLEEDSKNRTPKVEIKNRLNNDGVDRRQDERRQKVSIKKPYQDDSKAKVVGRKGIATKIEFDDNEEKDQRLRVKIKNNLADETKKNMQDSTAGKIKSDSAVKLDMTLDEDKQQKEKVKISSKFKKDDSGINKSFHNKTKKNDLNDYDNYEKPRLRVKSNALHHANEKKEQVEAGLSETKNIIKVTKSDVTLFEKTPNVIITNRLDDGESEFHFSDIVEGRSAVNDGEIDLFDEQSESYKQQEREEEHRVSIHETDDDYKAFGDDVEGEYGSKLALGKEQRGKLIKKDKEIDIYNDDISSAVQDMNLEVKSLVEKEEGKNPMPSVSKNTKQRRVFRHELKYYISWADYMMLSKSLNALLKHDNNADPVTGDYYIRSLYFDDFKNSALTEKLSGIENRKKYRIRIYGLKDDLIRVERKNKTKDYISKDNLTLTRQEYDSVIAGDIEFLLEKDNQLAKDFYYEIKTKKLEPCVIVDYVREAFVHPIKNLRITFDKMVKSGRYDRSIFKQDVALASVLPPGQVVLEVKFEKGLPDYIIGVLNTISACNRSAISKYALCRKYES